MEGIASVLENKTVSLRTKDAIAPGETGMMFLRAERGMSLLDLVPDEGVTIVSVQAGSQKLEKGESWKKTLGGVTVNEQAFVTVIAQNAGDVAMPLGASLSALHGLKTFSGSKRDPAPLAVGRSRLAGSPTPLRPHTVGAVPQHRIRPMASQEPMITARHQMREAMRERHAAALSAMGHDEVLVQADAGEVIAYLPSAVAEALLRATDSDMHISTGFAPACRRTIVQNLAAALERADVCGPSGGGELAVCLTPAAIEALSGAMNRVEILTDDTKSEIAGALRRALGMEIIHAKAG